MNLLHPVVAAVLVAPPSLGLQQCADQPLAGSGTIETSYFGISVDIDDGRLLVGSHWDDAAGDRSGAAYVFDLASGSWTESARLVGDSVAMDQLGYSVSLDGSAALVGTLGAGRAIIFREGPTGWFQEQSLVPSVNESLFGVKTALAGDVAIISSQEWTHIPAAVYVFQRTAGTWGETQRLPSPAGSSFGGTIATDGQRALVYSGDPVTRSVLVYDLQGGQLVETGELVAEDLPLAGGFGASLAIQGGRAVVGAVTAENAQGFGTGAVYVFELSGGVWVQTAKLLPSDTLSGDWFGSSVDIDGDRLAVGATYTNDTVGGQGSAYTFELQAGAWVETSKILACQPSQGAQFGRSLALDAGRLVISAGRDSALGVDAGAVYVIELRDPIGTPYCSATVNSSGQPAHLEARGVRALGENELTLRTSGLPTGRFGYYLASQEQQFLPLFGGGQGNLCLDLPITRFVQNVLVTPDTGAVELDLDFTALPAGTAFLPGDTWSFQYWFRDVGNSSNTSDAVAVTFETNGLPAVQLPISTFAIEEQTTQIGVPVTLSQPAQSDVTVTWAESGTATPQVDYRVEAENPLVIPAGETQVLLQITIAEDALPEPDETVFIDITSAAGAVLGTSLRFELVIENDD